MKKQSAGILLYRKKQNQLEVMLVHPGGPFWKNKDEGAWSIPKGEFDETEDAISAAKREFAEETGQKVNGKFTALQAVKMKSSKMIYAFLLEHDFDVTQGRSNTFEMEWPPRSGKKAQFPEVDRYEWFSLEIAKTKITASQLPFIAELESKAKLL